MKKILALCIAALMLFVFAQTVALADDLILYEGFDDPDITNLHNYCKSSGALSEPAFWDSYISFKMQDDDNGGYAPYITGISGKQSCISTKPVEIGNNKVFVTFRLKVVDLAGGIIAITLKPAAPGASNGHDVLIRQGRIDTLGYWGSVRDYNFTPDMWYTYKFEFANVDGVNQASVYIYDDMGNEVISSGPMPGAKPTNGSDYNGEIRNALVSVYQYNGASTWAIDDVEIITLDPSVPVAVDKDSLPENIGSMHCKPEFDIKFNQFVDMENMDAIVADAAGNTVSAADYIVTPTGDDSAKVTFCNFLNKNTTYTISFNGIEAWSGADASNVTLDFTTEIAHMLSAKDSSIADSDGKAKVVITFEDTFGYPSTPVRVMAVVYENGMMTKLEYVNGTVDADGKLEAEFSTVDADDDVTVLVFDESNSLIPVSEAICLK